MAEGAVEVYLVKAFTEEAAGGNPAGVVLDADGLTDEQKQQIASEVGYSETAFVTRPDNADFKLDFFTPTKPIAHCGHATVASFALLRQLGKVEQDRVTTMTADGIREIMFEGERVFMEQSQPVYRALDHDLKAEALKSLGLQPNQLNPIAPIKIVSTGNRFLIFGVKTEEDLRSIHPDHAMISDISNRLDLIGFYVYTPLKRGATVATARMFAPYYGIEEEAATGMAAGPLSAFLVDLTGVSREEFVIQQGEHMSPPSPSKIIARVKREAGKIESVVIGGSAAVGDKRTVRV
ncbi:PhzF family phenazine biosynthesis isomerase [candidate division GN15 bacterium]|nr:PhzF family phenazine biosynthesis isomerase [candidate division GN15 bacterium]